MRSGVPGPKTIHSQSPTTASAARLARFKPRTWASLSASSSSSSPVAPSPSACQGPSRGSIIRSVTNQTMGMYSTMSAAMNHQFPAMLTVQPPPSPELSTAASVMPKSSASSPPGVMLAENPPETPAKAHAMPASG